MVVLSREDFDAIEFDAACSGDHRAAAERMSRLAETGRQTEGMPRSEAYVRAGEQWLLADDPAAAAQGFLRAMEAGGPFSIDPRVPLARALFLLGRNADADAIIRQLGSEPARDPRLCDMMAELLVERGDLPGALAWATAGVRLCLGEAPGAVGGAGSARAVPGAHDPGAHAPAAPARPEPAGRGGADPTELKLLLSLRFRIRNDLGLPEDDYDRLLDEPEAARPADTG